MAEPNATEDLAIEDFDPEAYLKSKGIEAAPIGGDPATFGLNMDGSVDTTDEEAMGQYDAHHGAYNDTDLTDPNLIGMAIGGDQAVELTGIEDPRAAQKELLGSQVLIRNEVTGVMRPVTIVDKAPRGQQHVEMTPGAHAWVDSNGKDSPLAIVGLAPAFDPEKYLASKGKQPQQPQEEVSTEGFDPEAYLNQPRVMQRQMMQGTVQARQAMQLATLPMNMPPDRPDAPYGFREDGTPKGEGFLGPLQRPDGRISTELSIGTKIDGKETLIPSLVPTLSPPEVQSLLNMKEGELPSPEIVAKAKDYATQRMAKGLSPFIEPGEAQLNQARQSMALLTDPLRQNWPTDGHTVPAPPDPTNAEVVHAATQAEDPLSSAQPWPNLVALRAGNPNLNNPKVDPALVAYAHELAKGATGFGAGTAIAAALEPYNVAAGAAVAGATGPAGVVTGPITFGGLNLLEVLGGMLLTDQAIETGEKLSVKYNLPDAENIKAVQQAIQEHPTAAAAGGYTAMIPFAADSIAGYVKTLKGAGMTVGEVTGKAASGEKLGLPRALAQVAGQAAGGATAGAVITAVRPYEERLMNVVGQQLGMTPEEIQQPGPREYLINMALGAVLGGREPGAPRLEVKRQPIKATVVEPGETTPTSALPGEPPPALPGPTLALPEPSVPGAETAAEMIKRRMGIDTSTTTTVPPDPAPLTPAPTVETAAGAVGPETLETIPAEFPIHPSIRMAAVAVRPNLMQFKAADSGGGTMERDRLQGPYDPLKAGLSLVWEPNDPAAYGLQGEEKYIIVNGHYRHDLRERLDVETFPGQILREADGISALEARRIGAEINIVDGKGTIFDAANFVRDTAKMVGSDVALVRARALGNKSRKASNIALASADDLYSAFINERITPDAAEAIALAAPLDNGLQRAGIDLMARKKVSAQDAANYVRALKSRATEGPSPEQGMLFATDDAALAQAEKDAKLASRIQTEISEQLNAVQGAAKRPERAKELNVDVKDPQALSHRVMQLRQLREHWNAWETNPEFVAQLAKGGDPAEIVKAGLEKMPGTEPAEPAAPPAAPIVRHNTQRFEAGKFDGINWQVRAVLKSPKGHEYNVSISKHGKNGEDEARAEAARLNKELKADKKREAKRLAEMPHFNIGDRVSLEDLDGKTVTGTIEETWPGGPADQANFYTVVEPNGIRHVGMEADKLTLVPPGEEGPPPPVQPPAAPTTPPPSGAALEPQMEPPIPKDPRYNITMKNWMFPPPAQGEPHLIIVGCGALKQGDKAQAQDLYTSNLFKLKRQYAEAQARPWMILSAKHGLVEPGKVLEPYDVAITNLDQDAMDELMLKVFERVRDYFGGESDLADKTIQVLAGKGYLQPLEEVFADYQMDLVSPVTGMGVGKQQAFYKKESAKLAKSPTQPPAPPSEPPAGPEPISPTQAVTANWENAIVPVSPPVNIEEQPLYEELRSRAIQELGLKPWANWNKHKHADQIRIDEKVLELARAEAPDRLQVRNGVTYLNGVALIGWFRRKIIEGRLAAASATKFPQPNEHGVYREEDAELVQTPPRKDRSHAKIHLLNTHRGWIASVDYNTSEIGQSEPLSDHLPAHKTRQGALLDAIESLTNRLEAADSIHRTKTVRAQIKRLLNWSEQQLADTLNPKNLKDISDVMLHEDPAALRQYRKLAKMRTEGTISPMQSAELEQIERAMGQAFLVPAEDPNAIAAAVAKRKRELSKLGQQQELERRLKEKLVGGDIATQQELGGKPPEDERGNMLLFEGGPTGPDPRWFGKSKVVDASGNPAIMLHGSRSERLVGPLRTTYGAYFTSDPSYSEFFQEVGRDFGAVNPPLLRAYLKVEHPKIYDGENPKEFDEFTQTRQPSEELAKQGYDGEIMRFADGHMDVRVNRPDQIRYLPGATGSTATTVPSPGSPGLEEIGDRPPGSKVIRGRSPELQHAIRDLMAGKITRAEYDTLVQQHRPISTAEEVPTPATQAEMLDPIDGVKSTSKPLVGKATRIPAGTTVGLRTDLPWKIKTGKSAVVVHSSAGKVLAFESTGRVLNPTFVGSEKQALKIAGGESRTAFAVVRGKWSPDQTIPVNVRDWTQVGFDPTRHSYFYDKETVRPVIGGAEAIQIGNTVFVRDPVYGEISRTLYEGDRIPLTPARAKQTLTPAFRDFFGNSAVVDRFGNPLIVSHGTAAKTDFDKFTDPEAGELAAWTGKTQGKSGFQMLGRVKIQRFFFAAHTPVSGGYALKYRGGIKTDPQGVPIATTSYHSIIHANRGARVIPVYLSMQDPLVIDAHGDSWQSYATPILQATNLWAQWKVLESQNLGGMLLADELKAKRAELLETYDRASAGRDKPPDGVIIRNVRDNFHEGDQFVTDVYVVFEPTQVKSATGNVGTFSKTDPSYVAEGLKPKTEALRLQREIEQLQLDLFNGAAGGKGPPESLPGGGYGAPALTVGAGGTIQPGPGPAPGGSLTPRAAQLRAIAFERSLLANYPNSTAVIGQYVPDRESLARVLSIYWNPRFEIFRWILRDRVTKRIRRVIGYSLGLPGSTAILPTIPGKTFRQQIQELDALASSLNCELLMHHNHPSTNPEFSMPDVTLSEFVSRFAKNFGGHITTDGGKYGWYDPVLKFPLVHDMETPPPGLAQRFAPSALHPIIGRQIDTTSEMAQVAKDTMLSELSLVFVDSDNRVRALYDLDLAHLSDGATATATIRELAREVGGREAILYMDQKHITAVGPVAAQLLANNVIWDAVVSGQDKPVLGRPIPGTEIGPSNKLWMGIDVRGLEPVRVEEPQAPYGAGPDQLGKTINVGNKVDGYREVELRQLDKIPIADLPALLELAKAMGMAPPKIKFIRARGYFSPSLDYHIVLDARLAANFEVAAKTFAHEIFHAEDFLPDQTMDRGNLLGRLAKIKSYLKATLPIDPKSGETALTKKDRYEMRKEAQKLAGPKPGKKATEGELKAWQEQVNQHYLDLLNQALKTRGLATDVRTGGRKMLVNNVREELIALSDWWKPYLDLAAQGRLTDNYIQYRESGVELYADFGSVLMNSPADAKQRAPTAFEVFFNHLDKRPDVRDAFFEMWDLLGPDGARRAESRRQEIQRMFTEGQERLNKAIEERTKGRTVAGFVHAFRTMLDTRYWPAIGRERIAAKGGHEGALKRPLEWLFDAHPLADNDVYVWLTAIDTAVRQKLLAAGMTEEELGEFLFFDRVKNESYEITGALAARMENEHGGRAHLFNPGGHTPKTADEQLAHLEAKLGKDKFEQLEELAQVLRDQFYQVMVAMRAEGMISDHAWDIIEQNKESYAPFVALEYASLHVPSGIYQQIGFLGDVANPYTSLVLKGITAIRAIAFNKAKRLTAGHLLQYFSPDVTVAPMKWDGKRNVPQKPRDPNLKLVSYMEAGKRAGIHTTDDLADMLEFGDGLEMLTTLLAPSNWFWQNVFYPSYITFSPLFQYFRNPMRDIRSTGTNLPDEVSFWQAIGTRWGETRTMVKAWVKEGKVHPDILAALDARAVPPPMGTWQRQLAGEDMFIAIASRFGLVRPGVVKEGHWAERMPWFGWIFRQMAAAGQIRELVPKIGVYRVLTQKFGYSPADAAGFVRNSVGTPPWIKQGKWTHVANQIFPFQNVWQKGFQRDAKLARGAVQLPSGRRPKSAASWWIRWLLQGAIPKLLMAAGAAGLFGEAIKLLYSRVGAYWMNNYDVIPIGERPGGTVDGNTTVFLAIPKDFTDRVMGAFVYILTRGLFDAIQGNKQVVKPSDVIAAGTSDMPALNPTIKIPVTWSTYLKNGDPYDSFLNRNILTDNQREAGFAYTIGPMLNWTWNQVGTSTWIQYNPNLDTIGERVFSAIPGLNGVVKWSDQGLREQAGQGIREERGARARIGLDMPRTVQQLRTEYDALKAAGEKNRTPIMQMRYDQLSVWNRDVYEPFVELSKVDQTKHGDEVLMLSDPFLQRPR